MTIFSSLSLSVKDDNIWATVLVIAYLRVYENSKKDEWDLITEKAIDWLKTDQGQSDVEALIKKAEAELKKLIKK